MAGETYSFLGGSNKIVWTASEYSAAALSQVPNISLVEYQQESSFLRQAANYWLDSTTYTSNGYGQLYLANPTGNKYILPYYSSIYRRSANTWEEHSGEKTQVEGWISSVKSIGTGILKLTSPNVGILKPQSWKGTAPEQYTVELKLLNTTTRNGYINNLKFLNTLTRQNLSERTSWYGSTPPCIYTVNIPGVRWCPAAYIASVEIQNEGTMNKINNGLKELTIPDAWNLSIVIQEMLPQTRQIFDSIDGDVVSVIGQKDNVPGLAEGESALAGLIGG
jgi:hypothetical protein